MSRWPIWRGGVCWRRRRQARNLPSRSPREPEAVRRRGPADRRRARDRGTRGHRALAAPGTALYQVTRSNSATTPAICTGASASRAKSCLWRWKADRRITSLAAGTDFLATRSFQRSGRRATRWRCGRSRRASHDHRRRTLHDHGHRDARDPAGDLAGRRRVSERIFCLFLRHRGRCSRWRGPIWTPRCFRIDRRASCGSAGRRATGSRCCERFPRRGDIVAIAAIDPRLEASTFGDQLARGLAPQWRTPFWPSMRGSATPSRLRVCVHAVRSGVCLGPYRRHARWVWQAMGLDEQLSQLSSGIRRRLRHDHGRGRAARCAIGALEGQKVLRWLSLPASIDELVASPCSR